MSQNEQPIATAPKDGSTVLLPLNGWVSAYWDVELQTWVLARPLHIESIRSATTWKAA